MTIRNKFVSFLKEQIHHCFSYVNNLDKIKGRNHPQTEFIISIEANSTLFVKVKCKICNLLCILKSFISTYDWRHFDSLTPVKLTIFYTDQTLCQLLHSHPDPTRVSANHGQTLECKMTHQDW